MIWLRSATFNALFYLNLTVQLIVFAPVFFMVSEETAWRIVKRWARSSLWLLETVVGARSVVAGLDNRPDGGAILAAKHQSYWDVLILLISVERPTFILKKELMHIPLFGMFARRMAMIPVDRKRRGGAIASLVEGARKAAAENRQIVIFPEGTRTLPGAAVEYRQGVYRLYEALDLPVVPIALNSGVFWHRHGGRRLAGTVQADFLEPIEPGLDRDPFMERLHDAIERRSAALIRQARENAPGAPAGGTRRGGSTRSSASRP